MDRNLYYVREAVTRAAAVKDSDPALHDLLIGMAQVVGRYTWRPIATAPRELKVINGDNPPRAELVVHEIWSLVESTGRIGNTYWLPAENRWVNHHKPPHEQPTLWLPYRPELPVEMET